MKRLLIAAVVAVTAFSAQAETVSLFSCQTADKEKVEALKDVAANQYVFRLTKPDGKVGLQVEAAEQDMTLVRRYHDDGDMNSLLFTIGDIEYAVNADKQGKQWGGDAEVVRMGTSVYYSKCESNTIKSKLSDDKLLANVNLVD